jgi:MFS family permease
MTYIQFFLKNKRLITFGFMMAFFSSFGQTFLVSLYVPHILAEFHLTRFTFGLIYGIATVMSALTLSYVGKFIDHTHLRPYTFYAVALLIAACLFIAFAVNPFWVFIGFWALRLSGQGLCTHISRTTISKFFHKTRGMALSLSVLGHSTGEAIFPFSLGLVIKHLGWQGALIASGVFIGVTLVPFVAYALNDQKIPIDFGKDRPQTGNAFSRRILFKDQRFYTIAFNSFVLFSIITGLFFYQLLLAEEKGWSVQWITACFTGFAIGRIIFTLIGGKMVDRFTALAMFPFYLIPFALGLTILAFGDHAVIAPVYFILTGISVGFSSTLITALLTEIYGTQHLGGIRAVLATITVFSTAVSPPLFGYLLDQGFGFTFIASGSAALVGLAIFFSSRLPTMVSRTSAPAR